MALIGNIEIQLGSSEARQPLCTPAGAFFIEFSGARLHEGGKGAALVGVFPMCLPPMPTRLFCTICHTTVSLAIWCSPTRY